MSIGAADDSSSEQSDGDAPTDDPTLGATSTMLTTGEPTADGPASTTASEPETDADTQGDTGAEGPCGGVPAFQCSGPIDCDGVACGDVLSPFDASGCMRTPCGSPGDCDEDQLCFFPNAYYGVCTSSGMTCSDGPTGACECTSDPDCGGGYCMTDCFALPDAASCERADCGSTVVVEITETCECVPDTHVCFQSPAGFGSFDYMWHEETGMVAYFGPRWPQVPIGWHLCSEPGSPPACGCNGSGAPPRCP